MAIQAHPIPVYPYAPVPPSQINSTESIAVQPNALVPIRIPIFAVPLIMHGIIQRFIVHFGPNGLAISGVKTTWSMQTWKTILGLSTKSIPGTNLDQVEEGIIETRYASGPESLTAAWRGGAGTLGQVAIEDSHALNAPTERLRNKKLHRVGSIYT